MAAPLKIFHSRTSHPGPRFGLTPETLFNLKTTALPLLLAAQARTNLYPRKGFSAPTQTFQK